MKKPTSFTTALASRAFKGPACSNFACAKAPHLLKPKHHLCSSDTCAQVSHGPKCVCAQVTHVLK